MRILHVLATLDPRIGDAARAAHDFWAAAARLGHRFEFATLDDPIAPFAMNATVPLHALGTRRDTRGPRAWLARHAGNYAAIVIHDPARQHALMARDVAKQSRVPFFVLCHGAFARPPSGASPMEQLRAAWRRSRAAWVARDAAGMFFSSAREAALAQPPVGTVAQIVGGGIPPPPDRGQAGRAATALADGRGLGDSRVVLFDAPLDMANGIDVLLEGCARVRVPDDFLLVACGPDPGMRSGDLDARARRLHLGGRVAFAGMLHGDVRWSLVRRADLIVVPTRRPGFDARIAGALACGVPALLSDQVDMAPTVVARGAGWIDAGDADGMANGLRQWLAASPEELARMRAAALCCWRDEFAIDRATARLVRAIETRIIRTRAETSPTNWFPVSPAS